MGGSQALHIGLNHRELFAHLAAFGGALIMYGGRYGEWFPRTSVAGPDVPQSLYSSVGSGDFFAWGEPKFRRMAQWIGTARDAVAVIVGERRPSGPLAGRARDRRDEAGTPGAVSDICVNL